MRVLKCILFFATSGIALASCSSSKNSTIKGIEPALVKALQWQEANPIFAKAPTDWTNGAYYTGVSVAHAATGNVVFLNALKKMGASNNWQPYERFYHADDLAICYSYLYLDALGTSGVNLAPTAQIITDHLGKPHEWRSGTAADEKKILWWWCDALFMAPPVLVAYAKEKSDNSYIEKMDIYYKQTYDMLYNKEEHLFARDGRFLWQGTAKDLKEPNGKKIFWSRGNGWVIAGLALVLQQMPANYKNRAFYENLFREMAERIKALQPADGLWRTSLLCPEAYDHGEVSGSGFFTYALAWGVNNGLLNKKEYAPAITKAWNAIAACQQSDGKVGWVQGIGADPRPASVDSWQNFGTGAFLMAGSEVMKMK